MRNANNPLKIRRFAGAFGKIGPRFPIGFLIGCPLDHLDLGGRNAGKRRLQNLNKHAINQA
jgi:hypothetical protein